MKTQKRESFLYIVIEIIDYYYYYYYWNYIWFSLLLFVIF